MPHAIKFHTFRRRKYRIQLRRRHKSGVLILGETDHPSVKKKHVWLNPEQTEKRSLDTALHEGLHACFWELDEKAILHSARDTARLLWKLGWRWQRCARPLPRVREHCLRGNTFLVQQRRECCLSPSRGDRIKVCRTRGDMCELIMTLWSVLLLALPELAEEVVAEAASDLGSFLCRLGWQRCVCPHRMTA